MIYLIKLSLWQIKDCAKVINLLISMCLIQDPFDRHTNRAQCVRGDNFHILHSDLCHMFVKQEFLVLIT